MSYCVLTLTKRVKDTDLTSFHQKALQCAREYPAPAGCSRRAHSQTLPKGYRNGELVYDTLDEYAFDDFDQAQAWRQHMDMGCEKVGMQVDTLLTRFIEILTGPAAAGGLKHIELMRRRKNMDLQSFRAYWREVHGPLAAAIPTVRRYHQLPTSDEEYAQDQPCLDGLAVLWFDSTESMREGAQHPAFRMTREDMPRLVDLELSTSLLMREVWSSCQF